MDDNAGLPGLALRQVRRHPGHLLVPAAVVAAAGGLATTVQTVVHAWSAPTLLRDGTFTFAEDSTAATVTSIVAAVLLAVATTAVLSLVGLLAAAHELRRRPSGRAALREVGRRWALVLAGSVLLVAAGAASALVLVALSSALPAEGTARLLIPALMVVVVVVSVLAGRIFPAALVQDLGAFPAWRLIHAQRRSRAAARCYRNTVGLSLAALTLGAAATWAVGRLPESLGHPTLDAAESLVQVVGVSLALAVLAVGSSQAHVNATQLATRMDDRDALAWPGVDRVAPPAVAAPAATPPGGDPHVEPNADADAASAEAPTDPEPATDRGRTTDLPLPSWGQPLHRPTPRERAWRRTAWARTPWTGVIAVWTAAPLALLAVVTTNPTPAIEPVAVAADARFYDTLFVPYRDGVVLASDDELTYCTAEDGCHTEHPFRTFDVTEAVADPAGAGIALIGENLAEPEDPEYVLRACDPLSCDTYDDDPMTEARLFGDPGDYHYDALTVLAAQDGAYAAVYASGEFDDAELTLIRCATASCRQPRTASLGNAGEFDVVRAAFAPDGTLWVLQATADRDTVRLRSLAPDATTPVDALTLEIPGGEYGYSYSLSPHQGRPPIFELAVRDDGTPVVLYRDTTDRTIILTNCEDAACTTTTSTRLPFDTVITHSAQLAIDSTGRPLIATTTESTTKVDTATRRAYRDHETLLHSCVDRACTSMRSGLISTGFAGETPFMVLDARERPIFRSFPDDGTAEVLFCSEARCGL